MAMLVINSVSTGVCGGALKDLHSSPFVQHVIRGISLQELKG